MIAWVILQLNQGQMRSLVVIHSYGGDTVGRIHSR
jgi:hypothetical protein